MKTKLMIKVRGKGIFTMSFFLLACLFFLQCQNPAEDNTVDLETGFIDPPASAKPRVWYHWANNFVSKEGIRADLEWMHRIGIGGFHHFEYYTSTNFWWGSSDRIPPVKSPGSYEYPMPLEKRLIDWTPQWNDAFLFMTKLADSLGFEMGIHASQGWSVTGGPWVTPAQAMKKLVWSEIRIKGGEPFTGVLPKPPSISGGFQNIGGHEFRTISSEEYYADNAVIAFRSPEKDIPLIVLKPKVTSSGGRFDLTQLTDGDLAKTTLLPVAKNDKQVWVQFEFADPIEIKSLTIASTGSGGQLFSTGGSRALEASDDGMRFRNVVNIPAGNVGQQTITFLPAAGKYFRVVFSIASPVTTDIRISELVLHPIARVHRFEDKAAFAVGRDLYEAQTPHINPAEAIDKANVIDLTSRMQPDGTLTWTPPEGRWVILRFGYSLTGRQNHPASPEGTGLEVDKLNSEHVKDFFNHYLKIYEDASGGMMGQKGLQNVLVDSYEAGVQNWTENMIKEFNTRRGYNMITWLPVLAGNIVESAESSDRFLWDFRKTIADLTTENHYDLLTTILKDHGMERYSESHEGGRAFIADGMEVKRTAIPMGAMTARKGEKINYTSNVADVRESASVSHIYGKNVVALEALTSNGTIGHWDWNPSGTAWSWSPEELNPIVNLALSNGANRLFIQSSIHQPVDNKKPGISLGRYGIWFNRHETWAEEASSWMTYISRCCYMLQQGKYVADIIYFYGEDNNITSLFGAKLPDIPEGFSYDFVNSDALINVLSVKKGKIVTPEGMSYYLLALDPNSQQMSLPVLRKINEMVKAGATIVGSKPNRTPGLSDDMNEFKTIADQLWGTGNSLKKVGKGRVYGGHTLPEVLNSLRLAPDFSYTKSQENTSILFLHRKTGNTDIYWVENRNDCVENIEAKFRVDGKSAEIWHPETGMIEQASYIISDGFTKVSLQLDPYGAMFVVFRKKAINSSFTLPAKVETQLAAVEGPWIVSFQPERGAPDQITLDNLTSWSENSDQGVKYFSGTGRYTKTIYARPDWFRPGTKLWLDLGEVKNLAKIVVNGNSLGIVWKKPFRVDVTDVLKPGENKLGIDVTNLWVNRLIGDQQPGITKKYTYIATRPLHKPDMPLVPSGLLGPVKINRLADDRVTPDKE